MWPQAEDTRERSESILEGHLSINLDLTPVVIKRRYDQGQLFRFGFGTRF